MYVAKEGYQCKPGIQCQLFKINVGRHSGLSLQRYFTLTEISVLSVCGTSTFIGHIQL